MDSTTYNPAHKEDAVAPASNVNEFLLLCTALFFTAITYLATLRFGFVYDDQQRIVANPRLRSWHFVPDYFRGADWHIAMQGTANYYRPVNFLWLRVNYALFGNHAIGWHAMAILLHLLATCLAYFVARRLTQRPLVAGLVALFFGVHPMTHEVVAWVTGNNEALWAIFVFGAFLCYLNFFDGRGRWWLLASCGLYAAGVLTKEMAIMLPALVFVYGWVYQRQAAQVIWSFSRRLWDAAAVPLCYVPVAVVYLVARMYALHGFSESVLHVSIKTFLLTLPSIAFFYFKQWLFPIHPREFYELPLSTSFNLAHVFLPICGLILIAAVLWLIRRRLGAREVTFAAAWMILVLLPALDFVIFPLGDSVHDRYFYVPSFGASLLLALALEKLAKGPNAFGIPRLLLLPVLGLTIILCGVTANAASYWRDNFTLFQYAYRFAPHTAIPRVNYAVELTNHGDYGEAIPIFEGVLKERPNDSLATYGLGEALYELGLLKPAAHFFEETEKLNPEMAGAYLHIGLIELKTGRMDDAVNDMRRALTLEPEEAGFHFALGMALQAQGSCKESRSELQVALALQPDLPHAREQIDKCVATSSAVHQSSSPTIAAASSIGRP